MAEHWQYRFSQITRNMFWSGSNLLSVYRRLTCIMKGHTICPSSNLIAFFQSNLTIFSGLILTSVHTRWIKLLNNQFYKHFMPNFQHVIKLSFFVNVFRLQTNSSSIPIISKRETHGLSLRTSSLQKNMTSFSLFKEDAFYLLFDKSNVNCNEYTKMNRF